MIGDEQCPKLERPQGEVDLEQWDAKKKGFKSDSMEASKVKSLYYS